jgi:hypothetical protein
MDIRTLLFSAPCADGNEPLFRTQLDLAEALIRVQGGGFERKSPENVRIFINQVLKAPNEPRSRPASPNFRKALGLAIHARISDPHRATDVGQKVFEALDQLKSHAITPAHDDEELGALWSATNNPEFKQLVVVTPNPAETVENEFSFATRLTDALIERVIVRENVSVFDESASYDFFILDKAKADGMRAVLVNRVAKRYKYTIQQADELVLDAQSNERLNIYHFEYDDYLPPMCVFEPNSNLMEGYELFYVNAETNTVSVAVKDRADLQLWKKTFHRKMYVDRIYNVTPVKGTVPIGERAGIEYLRAA